MLVLLESLAVNQPFQRWIDRGWQNTREDLRGRRRSPVKFTRFNGAGASIREENKRSRDNSRQP